MNMNFLLEKQEQLNEDIAHHQRILDYMYAFKRQLNLDIGETIQREYPNIKKNRMVLVNGIVYRVTGNNFPNQVQYTKRGMLLRLVQHGTGVVEMVPYNDIEWDKPVVFKNYSLRDNCWYETLLTGSDEDYNICYHPDEAGANRNEVAKLLGCNPNKVVYFGNGKE